MAEAEMRVPKAGQDLIERRIVREGKRLATVLLADYSDPPRFSITPLVPTLLTSWQQLLGRLRNLQIRL
jgi:hypothetical protein